MSRIGKNPIILNEDVSIELNNRDVIIEGPKGKLKYSLPQELKLNRNKKELLIENIYNSKRTKELHGLSRTIINNMIIGVSQGFSKILNIQGVGYRAQIDNKNNLILNVGYSHPVNITAPKNITIQVENSNKIIIHGIDKAKVGQIASKIREIRPPEPYKGKGIRYENEIVKKKVGKAGK